MSGRPANELDCLTRVFEDTTMIAERNFKLWDGIYGSFADAPASGPGFAGPAWEEHSLETARATLAQIAAGQPIDYSLKQRNAVLPILVAGLLSHQSQTTVLDFGGGLGVGFMVLMDEIKSPLSRVHYHIVELERICRAGANLFAAQPAPVFHDRLPAGKNFDIVYSSSVMQYIDDWRGKVAELAAFQARFLVFSDAFVGDFPTYATLQNYYGSKIPHWFLNFRDFVAAVESRGYSLVLRSECSPKILGRHGSLPMGNFPAELRVPASSHLLFQRNSA